MKPCKSRKLIIFAYADPPDTGLPYPGNEDHSGGSAQGSKATSVIFTGSGLNPPKNKNSAYPAQFQCASIHIPYLPIPFNSKSKGRPDNTDEAVVLRFPGTSN